MVEAVEERDEQSLAESVGGYSLQCILELGCLNRYKAGIDRALQAGSRLNLDLEVAKSRALKAEAMFANRPRGALPGEDDHRDSRAGQKRSEEPANAARTEHRHTVRSLRHKPES
jgi:hypothetical protein